MTSPKRLAEHPLSLRGGVQRPRRAVRARRARRAWRRGRHGGQRGGERDIAPPRFPSDLFDITCYLFVAIALYLLLKHVNQHVAAAMLIFVAVGTAI